MVRTCLWVAAANNWCHSHHIHVKTGVASHDLGRDRHGLNLVPNGPQPHSYRCDDGGTVYSAEKKTNSNINSSEQEAFVSTVILE